MKPYKSHPRKLTPTAVRLIVQRVRCGERRQLIADENNISKAFVTRIMGGFVWSWATGIPYKPYQLGRGPRCHWVAPEGHVPQRSLVLDDFELGQALDALVDGLFEPPEPEEVPDITDRIWRMIRQSHDIQGKLMKCLDDLGRTR
jgi:hypothetical protein